MRHLNRILAVLVAAISLLAIPACGDDSDSVTEPPVGQVIEAGLNSVIANTVEPLFAFYGAISSLVAGPASALGGFICPDTTGVCAGGGSVTCTPSGLSLDFDFNACVVATGDGALTLDGAVSASPGTTIELLFQGLVINGSPAMTGSGSITTTTCTSVVNVTTSDGSAVQGTIVECDSDDYPTAASHVTVTFSSFLINVIFDGSSTASAIAIDGGNIVSTCVLDLAAHPVTASCI